jgi:hypothetical protein
MGFNSAFNPLNADLNPIYCLLALLGAHHFLHFSRIRVKYASDSIRPLTTSTRIGLLTHSRSETVIIISSSNETNSLRLCGLLLRVRTVYRFIKITMKLYISLELLTVLGKHTYDTHGVSRVGSTLIFRRLGFIIQKILHI